MRFTARHAGLLLVLVAAQFCGGAQAQNDPRKDFVALLDETNIRQFLEEVSQISTGQRADLLDEDVVDYFTNHMAEKGEFQSTMRYQIPGFPTQDTVMKLSRDEYINVVVKGRFMLEDYTTAVDVQDLKISGNGKSATFKSITRERGKMPFLKDPEKKDVIEMIPIQGESVCDQKLIVSFNNFIQMAQAECTTVISFDPFGGKPLVPE